MVVSRTPILGISVAIVLLVVATSIGGALRQSILSPSPPRVKVTVTNVVVVRDNVAVPPVRDLATEIKSIERSIEQLQVQSRDMATQLASTPDEPDQQRLRQALQEHIDLADEGVERAQRVLDDLRR